MYEIFILIYVRNSHHYTKVFFLIYKRFIRFLSKAFLTNLLRIHREIFSHGTSEFLSFQTLGKVRNNNYILLLN